MIYKNAQENKHGSIDCLILLSGEWVPTTQDPAIEYKLSEELEADDWSDIKPCDQAEKDAHKVRVERDAIIAEITALDVQPHTLARALSGDEYALNLVKANEALKAELRKGL